jgi:probable HAF family extracellular repeat protein
MPNLLFRPANVLPSPGGFMQFARLHLTPRRGGFVIALLVLLLPICEAQVYRIKKLPTLGGPASNAHPSSIYGITQSGQATGCSSAGLSSPQQHVFLWTPTTGMQDLGVTCTTNTQPGGLNDLGHVASSTDFGGFLWTPMDGFQNLGKLAFGSVVNNHDRVAGRFWLNQAGAELHAFSWTPENPTIQDLGTLGGKNSFAFGINDLGQVVGLSETHGADAPFIWSETTGMQKIGKDSGSLTRSIISGKSRDSPVPDTRRCGRGEAGRMTLGCFSGRT